jgi:hypothetical protein
MDGGERIAVTIGFQVNIEFPALDYSNADKSSRVLALGIPRRETTSPAGPVFPVAVIADRV